MIRMTGEVLQQKRDKRFDIRNYKRSRHRDFHTFQFLIAIVVQIVVESAEASINLYQSAGTTKNVPETCLVKKFLPVSTKCGFFEGLPIRFEIIAKTEETQNEDLRDT